MAGARSQRELHAGKRRRSSGVVGAHESPNARQAGLGTRRGLTRLWSRGNGWSPRRRPGGSRSGWRDPSSWSPPGLSSGPMAGATSEPLDGVVAERQRAAGFARHCRDQERLSIAEIARLPGRAEAAVKAHLYDPSYANKRPTGSSQGRQFCALLVMHRRRSAKRRLGSRCDGTRPASRLPHLSGCGSVERPYNGPRYCP